MRWRSLHAVPKRPELAHHLDPCGSVVVAAAGGGEALDPLLRVQRRVHGSRLSSARRQDTKLALDERGRAAELRSLLAHEGFEVELAAALARELGVRAELVQNDWSNLVPSLERGTFDVVMNGLEVTEGRVGRVLFSRPYYVFAE